MLCSLPLSSTSTRCICLASSSAAFSRSSTPPAQSQFPAQQQQQQPKLKLATGRKYVQLWKTKRPRRKRRLLDAPTDPDDPLWGTTRRERKALLQQQREALYGPHAADRDVRLYLKRRELNAARVRPSRRGGFPLDDSFDQPGTFLKLGADFQRIVLCERVDALVSTLPRLSPAEVWRLYTTTPGLLTLSTVEVAHRLTGLAAALGLHTTSTLDYLCTFRPLAFMQPDSVASRLGLCAKVARLDTGGARRLMMQHPQLWLISSRVLAPRVEALSLLLHCCPVTSIRLIGSCHQLLTTHLGDVQQQLAALCSLMGCQHRPQQVVPLLLWRPALLLPHTAAERQHPTPSPAGTLDQQQLLQHQCSAPTQPPAATDGDQHQGWSGTILPGATWTAQQQVLQQQQQLWPGSMSPVSAVQDQLHDLSTALQLPMQLVQDMVLRAPELLDLAAGGPDTIAAAVDNLSNSWLMAQQGGLRRRQHYQQQLLQVLRPQEYSSGRKHRKVQQSQGLTGAAAWYDAGQVLDAAVLRCQWWQQQGGGQVSGLQQLLLQAPALLVLVADSAALGQASQPGTSPPQSLPSAAAAAQQSAVTGTQQHRRLLSRGVGDVLGYRLKALCEHLLPLQTIQSEEPQPQQERHQQLTSLKAAAAALCDTQDPLLPGQPQPQQQGEQQLHANQRQGRQQQQQQQQLMAALKQVAVLEPCTLMQAPGSIAAQVLQLSKALQVPSDRMLALVLQHPGLLWLTQSQVFEVVRVVCGIMKLPARQVKHLVACENAAQLLLLHPEAIKRGFSSAVARFADGDESRMRRVLMQNPSALLPGNMDDLRPAAV